MLKKVLIAVGALVVVFLAVVAMQPSEFSITRSATFDAPPSVVFAQVNDFHNWNAWSPWAKMDPNAKNTFDGPQSGPGAMFAWEGDKNVGAGKMTILDTIPNELVHIQLDFVKPFVSTADTKFQFASEGGKTTVTWTMSGKNNFMSRAFCLFMNMDKMVGGDFEKGLASMKEVAESSKKTH